LLEAAHRLINDSHFGSQPLKYIRLPWSASFSSTHKSSKMDQANLTKIDIKTSPYTAWKIFLLWELPVSTFMWSVSELYIPTMGLPVLLEEICRLILGIYKSLTDT